MSNDFRAYEIEVTEANQSDVTIRFAFPSDFFTIGSGEQAALRLDGVSIKPVHAQVTVGRKGKVTIIMDGAPFDWQLESAISIDKYRLSLRTRVTNASTQSSALTSHAVDKQVDVTTSQALDDLPGRAYLAYFNHQTGMVKSIVEFNVSEITIGSGLGDRIRLKEADNVSARQVQLVVRGASIFLINNGKVSINVKGMYSVQEIEAAQWARLSDGSQFQIADYTFVLHIEEEQTTHH